MQLGKTKVFLRAGQIAVLDSRRAEVLDAAAKRIQGRLRTFLAHREFVTKRVAAISLQACCRGIFSFLKSMTLKTHSSIQIASSHHLYKRFSMQVTQVLASLAALFFISFINWEN